MLNSLTLKRIKTNIPLKPNFSLYKKTVYPSKKTVPNLNYYFSGSYIELPVNTCRLYRFNDRFYSDTELIQKNINSNGVNFLILKKEFIDIPAVDIIETNILKLKIGTYTIPNTNFKSTLFKANTSYIFIKNGVLGIANKFSDIQVVNGDVISLYESAFKINPINIGVITPLENKSTTYFDLLLNEVSPDIRYFPFVYNNLGKFIFSIQLGVARTFPSILKTYADFKIYDELFEFDEDFRLNKVIPDTLTFNSLDTDNEIYSKIMSIKTFNDNNRYDINFNPFILAKTELKMMMIREFNGTLKYYYGCPFNMNTVFIYNGKFYDEFTLVNIKTNVSGIDGQITTDMNYNYALFPISIIPTKMFSLVPNHNIDYSYEVDETAIVKFSDEKEYDHIDKIRIYPSYKRISFKKSNDNDLIYLNELTKDNIIVMDKNGIFELPSDFNVLENIILNYFGSDNLLNISLPDSTCVIANKNCKLVDITSTQNSDMLDRGIIVVPDSYHILFVNGYLVNTTNFTRLFGDFKLIDGGFYDKKIKSVKIYTNTELLTGRINMQNILASIEFMKESTLINHYSLLYSVRNDSSYVSDNTVFVGSNNMKGIYDRFYSFMKSNIVDDLLSLPEGDPRFDAGLVMIKRIFSNINAHNMGLQDGDTRICIPSGTGNDIRYNPFE